MNRLRIELKNCYGISELSHNFDFSKNERNDGVNSLYAPNGSLKTSLAKTFKDIQDNQDSKDLIFSSRETTRVVLVDNVEIEARQIMVIDSYNESYSSQQVSTLLVNENLKKQYELVLKEIEEKRGLLIKAISKSSGITGRKESVEFVICSVFGRSEKDFFELVSELKDQDHPDFIMYKDIKYSDIFTDKVIALITSGEFCQQLTEYVDTYEKLIRDSPILTKKFNHQKADQVTKNLGDAGFFSASHSVNLTLDGEKVEIDSHADLKAILEAEEEKVLQNPELKEKFEQVDSRLKNAETQKFRDYISEHHEILPELQDLSGFKKKLCLAYLQIHTDLWQELIDTYRVNQELIANIISEAKRERTIWESVVEIFNRRFNVPFDLSVDNQDDVILHDAAPVIKFEFNDGRGVQQVNRGSLLETLSQGEKRALYILNILFEIEFKKQQENKILIIVDDIADSFDYKNKYAIVEYLKDISKFSTFSLLMLTHNFDFHRTISSRLSVKRQNRLMAVRTNEKIVLNQEKYQNDVLNAWKNKLGVCEVCLLACIPFVRNLVEYCYGQNEYYMTLTSLLHLKPDTLDIKIKDIQIIYRDVFKDKARIELADSEMLVKDKLFEKSEALTQHANDSIELEDKVILAIAIRLNAEGFMIEKINDAVFVKAITSNQTYALFAKYSEKFPTELESIALLDQVNLMTPENIHLNSFMYEPILDMSAHHLYKLYGDINALMR